MACFAVALPMSQAAVVLQLSSAKAEKKKGFLDWLTEALDKSDITETDAILKKVEGKNNNGGVAKPSAGKKGSAPPPQKKGKLPLFGK